MEFFEEISKFRAARKMWAEMMRDRYRRQGPPLDDAPLPHPDGGESLMTTRCSHTTTSFAPPSRAMAAVLGGTQSLHTNGFDEALALPTSSPPPLALRTQRVIAHKDRHHPGGRPAGGGDMVESLTAELEAGARATHR